MHLLAVASTAVHMALCGPFWDSLLDLLYSSSLSAPWKDIGAACKPSDFSACISYFRVYRCQMGLVPGCIPEGMLLFTHLFQSRGIFTLRGLL